MAVTDELKKYTDTALSSFSEQWTEAQKPLFAVFGAYDAAFEQTKQLPSQVKGLFDELPSQVKALREFVEGTATQLQDSAVSFYSELAERGEKVYATLRGQAADKLDVGVEKVEEGADFATGAVEEAIATTEQAGDDVADKAEDVAHNG